MIVKVICYAGHRGEETPRRLSFDGRSVELAGEDGAIYLLRHDAARDCWELTMFQAPASR